MKLPKHFQNPIALLAVILVTGCSRENKVQQPGLDPQDLRAGEIMIQTDQPNAVEDLRARYHVEALDASDGAYLIRDAKIKDREDAVIRELQATGEFNIVERNTNIRIKSVNEVMPRDPKWLAQWSFKNYGQSSLGGIEGAAGADIGTTKAWNLSTGSRKIVVAVIDTGIDYSHPDLRSNIWTNTAELNGASGVDDDGNGFTDDIYGYDFSSDGRTELHYGQLGDADPMDGYGHGTHVAGTIGAVGNNAQGVAGINWQVSLMAVKFLSDAGFGAASDEYRSIRYATKMKAMVANASYGGGARSQLIEHALREAGAAGMLFVAAAGNDGSDIDQFPSYPAAYALDNVMTVAATDSRDRLAWFSNIGAKSVHLAAPGFGIISTYPVKLAKEEGNIDPYRTFSGTSMAAPHVAGAAALALAADSSFIGKPAALRTRLMATADRLPNLNGRVVSGGRLNVANAVDPTYVAQPDLNDPTLVWTEEAVDFRTPRFPTERVDYAWPIRKPGARAIRVHVASAFLDEGYDVARLVDRHYSPIVDLHDMMSGYWSPSIGGDTVYLKFSNSLVYTMDIFKGTICPKFANFFSEGVHIDRIQYLAN